MTTKLHNFLFCAVILSGLLCLSGCGAPASAPAPIPTEPPAVTAPSQDAPEETGSTLAEELASVEQLALVAEAKDLWDLLDYPNLKSVNLSASTCYAAILDLMDKNP